MEQIMSKLKDMLSQIPEEQRMIIVKEFYKEPSKDSPAVAKIKKIYDMMTPEDQEAFFIHCQSKQHGSKPKDAAGTAMTEMSGS